MMNLYFSKILILLLVCVLFGCRQNSVDKADGIAVIDVVNNLGKYHAIPVSEIVSELEYIPLQTTDVCLVGLIQHLIVTNTHIFVAGNDPSNSYCYVFSRDGRFIGQIGGVGQGPGEYRSIINVFIDEKNQLTYIQTLRTVLEYSWKGVFQKSINLPINMNASYISSAFYVCDNLFIGHVPNNRGNEINNFLLFNDSGQVIKAFDNYLKFERIGSNWTTLWDLAIKPFRISEQIYVKEYPNDTLYFLNEQNELIPQFVFNLGKYALPKSIREVYSSASSDMEQFIVIPDNNTTYSYPLIGDQNHIFFSFTGSPNYPLPKGIKRTIQYMGQTREIEARQIHGIYDIAAQTTRLLDTDLFSRMSGFINDLDGGMSFWPRYYTSDNELIDIWQAYEMKELLTEEYFAAHEIKNPQAHQKLKELLKNLEWDDNPVIVIAKLK